MVESLFSGFADISVPELILIGAMALVASVVGGVAGYGTGALMPLVLVPIVGGRAGRADPLAVGAVHQQQPHGSVPTPDRLAPGRDRARCGSADLRARRLGLY